MSRPVIVDANAVITRCVLGTALDDHRAGRYTGGVYATLSLLREILADPVVRPDLILACFDNGVPQSRRALIPGYKDGRKERTDLLEPEELERAFEQVGLCFDLLPLLGVVCVAFEDREADDCVAEAVRMFQEHRPVVVTSDRDLYQTVLDGADVYDFPRGRWVTADSFQDTTGVDPTTYVLFRTLVGDASDHIQGARGCGAKRAAALIDECFPEEAPDTPVAQLHRLCAILRGRAELRGYERAIVDDEQRLARVARGIDMRDSFGPAGPLWSEVVARPDFQPALFLRACKVLGLQSVLRDPERTLRPFRQAWGACAQKSAQYAGETDQA